MTENPGFKQLDDLTSRKIIVSGEDLMLAEVHFKKGGIGALHRHTDHEQAGYIAKGSFELTLGSEKKVVRQGDCYYAPKNVLHGVVALEDSIIIDSFTPIREDFLK
jgi:quercetin dioxygenase-like cupin family protein